MNRVTLVFTPKPQNGRELGQLVEAIAERLPVKAGKKIDEVEVGADDLVKVTKLLRMHGYNVVDKRIHEASKRPLIGALEKLNEKYLNEGMFGGTLGVPPAPENEGRTRERLPEPKVSKRAVMNYINSKVRNARQMRMKTRAQHKRDRLDGRIEALDDVIRYLRKKK